MNIAPNYLCNLLPSNNADNTNYNLRDGNNIKLPFCRTELFRRSFLPYTIRLWNKLEHSIRNSPSVHSFKRALKKNLPEVIILHYYGERWAAIHHARIRMQCSGLNYDLCYKLYVRDDPHCRCGAVRETAHHFFFDCPLYTGIRALMINKILRHTNCNLHVVLFGDSNLSLKDNRLIFDAVHQFILDSNRFI